MANTTLKRVPGIALVVAAASTSAGSAVPIAAFEDLNVDVTGTVANASAANAPWMQKVFTQLDGKGSISGFLGVEFPQTFKVGDEFYLTVVAGTSDVSMALKQAQTAPGKCRITKMGDKANKDPAKVSFDFEWGFVD